MEYKFEKIQGQEKLYEITCTKADGGLVVFTVGVSRDESEIPGLVQHHLAFLSGGAPSQPTYATKRQAEYPSFADQFDLLYHGGYDAWKAAIDAVKAKYPKP